MFERNRTVVVDVDGGTGREHLTVKFVELGRVLMCPVSKSRNSSDKIECVMESVHDLLLSEFSLSNLGDFGIAIGKSSESLIHSIKLFSRHERNDAIFTHDHSIVPAL